MPSEITVEELNAACSGVGPMSRALEKHGITMESLAKKLADELDACEVKTFNDREAGIVYSKDLVAWDVRQRARMDAQKLMGAYPPEVKHHKGRIDVRIIDEFPEEEPGGEV